MRTGTTSGLFRTVDIYDDHVEKIFNETNVEEGECEESEIAVAQANEITISKAYPNNLCFAPVLENSTIYKVRMQKANPLNEETLCYDKKDFTNAKSLVKKIVEPLISQYKDHSIWDIVAHDVVRPCLAYERGTGKYIDYLDFVKNFVKIYKQDKDLAEALMDDCHTGNLGIFNHRIVMIDYGCVNYCYDTDYYEQEYKWYMALTFTIFMLCAWGTILVITLFSGSLTVSDKLYYVAYDIVWIALVLINYFLLTWKV